MISKTPIVVNEDAIEKAESMNLPLPNEEFDFIDFGFRLQDIMYYKIISSDKLIELTFRNGKTEHIQFTNSVAAKLNLMFEKL